MAFKLTTENGIICLVCIVVAWFLYTWMEEDSVEGAGSWRGGWGSGGSKRGRRHRRRAARLAKARWLARKERGKP